jgi:hypothetical protein
MTRTPAMQNCGLRARSWELQAYRCRFAIRRAAAWKPAKVLLSSALPIAGFAIIEAADLAEAIEKVSGVPCAVAHGVVEVWPLKETA